MKHMTSITAERNQASDEAWEALEQAILDRNLDVRPMRMFGQPVLYLFPVEVGSEAERVLRATVATIPGLVTGDVYEPVVWEDSDFATADLVEFSPVELFDEQDRFCPPGQFSDPPDCSSCGRNLSPPVVRQDPVRVNLAFLGAPANNGREVTPPPPGGWECLSLPSGHPMISARVLEAFRPFRGWTVSPLADLAGNPIPFFRLGTDRKFVPFIADVPVRICPGCGFVSDEHSFPVSFSEAVIGGADVFSQLESGRSMFARRPLADALLALGTTGLQPYSAARIVP